MEFGKRHDTTDTTYSHQPATTCCGFAKGTEAAGKNWCNRF